MINPVFILVYIAGIIVSFLYYIDATMTDRVNTIGELISRCILWPLWVSISTLKATVKFIIKEIREL